MDTEEKARTMGWVPLDEFRGDPERHVDADTFVDRGENIMPIMKERMSKFEDKIDTLNQTVSKSQKTIDSMVKMSEKTNERAYQKAVNDLKSEARLAVADGDVVGFDRVQGKMDALAEDQNISTQPPDNGGAPESEEFKQWDKENMWYGKDKDLTAYANGISFTIAQENKGADEKTLLELTRKATIEAFPDKFKNPKRNAPPAVEGAEFGAGGDEVKTGLSYINLPKEIKQVCDNDLSNGLYKTREEWLQVYEEG